MRCCGRRGRRSVAPRCREDPGLPSRQQPRCPEKLEEDRRRGEVTPPSPLQVRADPGRSHPCLPRAALGPARVSRTQVGARASRPRRSRSRAASSRSRPSCRWRSGCCRGTFARGTSSTRTSRSGCRSSGTGPCSRMRSSRGSRTWRSNCIRPRPDGARRGRQAWEELVARRRDLRRAGTYSLLGLLLEELAERDWVLYHPDPRPRRNRSDLVCRRATSFPTDVVFSSGGEMIRPRHARPRPCDSCRTTSCSRGRRGWSLHFDRDSSRDVADLLNAADWTPSRDDRHRGALRSLDRPPTPRTPPILRPLWAAGTVHRSIRSASPRRRPGVRNRRPRRPRQGLADPATSQGSAACADLGRPVVDRCPGRSSRSQREQLASRWRGAERSEGSGCGRTSGEPSPSCGATRTSTSCSSPAAIPRRSSSTTRTSTPNNGVQAAMDCARP